MRCRFTLAALWLCAVFGTAAAVPAGADLLRVGTSGDYSPFSVEFPGAEAPTGFDLDVAADFAATTGRPLVIEGFRWPALLANLRADRFDVAMSGVTITAERSAVGSFSIPVAETGAVVLARRDEGEPDLESLDDTNKRIGVNAGGYLERVARKQFRRASLIAIPDNLAVISSLANGNLDAVVTDTAEASEWMAIAGDVALLGPLTRDRKAYLVRADQPELAAELDRFLLMREADGTLAALRSLHLGANAGPATALPLTALLAAVDERLALMPLVALAKSRDGLPILASGRERVVLDAAVAAVGEAAAEVGATAPPDAAVRELTQALMEAAKQVQTVVYRKAGQEQTRAAPDLDTVLRPALLRIGAKIARLLVALPKGLGSEAVQEAAAAELRVPELSDDSRRAIADAVAVLSAAPAQ